MAGRIDAAFSGENRQATPKALRNGPEFEKICIRFDADFEKAGILTEVAGKDSYISTAYRLSSGMRSVYGGGIMPHADRVDLAGKWPLQGRARTRGERRGNKTQPIRGAGRQSEEDRA